MSSRATAGSTPSTDRQPEEGYRRDNYWGKDDLDDEPARGHADYGTLDLSKHKAWEILRGAADMLCGATLYDRPYAPSISDDLDAHDVSALSGLLWDGEGLIGEYDRDAIHRENEAVELSPAEAYPPADTPDGWAGDGTSRYHSARYNPETGYMNYGMSTWVELTDVDWPTLAEAIRVYCAEEELRDRKREFLLGRAKSMKKNPECDLSDLDILTSVLEQLKQEFAH